MGWVGNGWMGGITGDGEGGDRKWGGSGWRCDQILVVSNHLMYQDVDCYRKYVSITFLTKE